MLSSSTVPTVRVAFDTADGRAVLEAARRAAGASGDEVDVRAVGSPGTVHLPLVAITRGRRTTLHRAVDPNETAAVVSVLAEGDVPVEEADGVIEHDDATDDFPAGDGPLSAGVRRTLAGAGWVDPTAVDVPGVAGDDALDTLRALGLRGRGWGDARQDEPVAAAWRTARDADGDPVVVVNALDADPKADGDRLLVGSLTGRVLAGATLAARAVDADDVVVVLPEGETVLAERVRAVADTLAEADGPSVSVAAAEPTYMTAEPTALLESLEGTDRIEARRRPPGPAAWGLFERPTLVHTPRTLAAVARGIASPDDPDLDPDAADPGTRLVTVVGPDRRTVELPTDASLARALHGESAAFACVGGQFGGLTHDLDTPASAPALESAGLGTNGSIEAFADGPGGACPVVVAGRRTRVAREQNCGRCVPCRTGSVRAHELLREVYDGEFADGRLRELARTMAHTSLCGFGGDAARPLATALDAFEADLRAHAAGRCPAGVCDL